MSKIILSTSIALLLIFSNSNGHCAQYRKLSDQSKISLMTCGPGEAMYSQFGHSAIWVNDPINRIDRIYNYGTFDFDDTNFYYLFLRGIANYKLSVTNFRAFVDSYAAEDRTVEQQVLNLTLSEKQELFDVLQENYKPENRYYRYDFLFLNCSSVIRDKVFESLNRTYQLDETEYDHSFRDLLMSTLTGKWVQFGINLLLGHRADIKATNWERMFLPDYMRDQFELAKLGDNQMLAPDIKTIYLTTKSSSKNSFEGPTYLFLILFFIIGFVTKKKYSNHRWNKSLDSIIFSITGLIGFMLCFMWFFSKHEVVHENINILWAFPLHLILVIMIWIPALTQIVRIYGKVFFFVIILFIILGLFRVQEIPTAVYLLSGITMFRLFRLAFFPDMVNQVKS